MDYGLTKNAEKYSKKQKFRKKRNLSWLILGCIVVFCATYALILPAITQERDVYCGMEAHTHEETCYETVIGEELQCALEENDVHIHNEDCYKVETMVCTLEEHAHELICYSNPEADLETAEVWEATVSGVTLIGEPATDLAAIAESQKGYVESTRNFIVMEDGETTKGYSRYGAWYGEPYGDWSGMFGGFCLFYASVNEDVMLYDADCNKWMAKLQEQEKFGDVSAYSPGVGDVVFLDQDLDASADHIGIVTESNEENHTMIIIQGDDEGAVTETEWSQTDAEVLGYGMMPKPVEADAASDAVEEEAVPEDVKEEEVAEESVATEDTDSEEPKKSELKLIPQTIQATIYTDESYEYVDKDDKTVIMIKGVLPEDAVAKAYLVELEEDLIEGGRCITAYDIVVFDAEGKPFEKSAEDEELHVTIQPENWDKEKDESYHIYYVPDKGQPEMMESKTDDEAVSFVTDHFSTYALVATGTVDTVYLNGASGNDSRAGTSTGTAVQTIEKAMSLVKDGGTIYITGTVTITDAQELDVDGKVTFKRYSSFTGPLFTVADGGRLELADVTINGGSGTPNASKIAENSTYASGSAKAPLIVVSDGGSLSIGNGAKLEYNANQPNISSNKFVENGFIGLGGAVYCNGTLTMSGGLIQYCEAQCGGGVYVEDGSFYLSGGTIDHCYARDIVSYKNRVGNYHKNAGGGVYVGDNASMVMSGGTVSNNQSSREGGGISLGWLNRSDNAGIDSYITTFTMNGGTLSGNLAVSTGGGLNITAGRQAFINAGTITENTANGQEYQDSSRWVSSGTYTKVFSGGGIYIDAAQWSRYPDNYSGVPGKAVINRALITQNTATDSGGGIAACGTSENYIYGDKTNGTAIYENSKNEVYVSGGALELGDTLLGGGKYNWTGSGTYNNSLTDSSAAVVTAKKLATVYITNNTGYLGGGIGCNGLIEIGGEKEESTYINIKKVWEDDGKIEHPAYIEVQILQDGKPYGEPIRIYRTFDDKGNEIWPTFYVGGLPSGHKYTVKELEIPGYMATIEQNGQDFIITNRPEMISVSVEKVWADGTPGASSITIQLYQNGSAYGDSIKLNEENNWFYKWTNLPKKDDDGKEYQYSVSETAVAGYVSSIKVDTTGPTITTTKNRAWQQVSELEANGQYMFVYNGKALARSGDKGLGWLNVSTLLNTGESPANTALWTYTGGKLKNAAGKYLYISSSSASAENTGSTINFSDGYLSNTGTYTRYLKLDDNEKASAQRYQTDATKFTAYTLVETETSVSDEKADIHYIVTNTMAYELPETGGNGTNWFYITGIILTVVASGILITKRRMHNKDMA